MPPVTNRVAALLPESECKGKANFKTDKQIEKFFCLKSEKKLITHQKLRNYIKFLPKLLKTYPFTRDHLFAKVSSPNIQVADVCFTVARLRYALFYYKQNFPIFFCKKSQNISFLSKMEQFLNTYKKGLIPQIQNKTLYIIYLTTH